MIEVERDGTCVRQTNTLYCTYMLITIPQYHVLAFASMLQLLYLQLPLADSKIKNLPLHKHAKICDLNCSVASAVCGPKIINHQ